jgi:8-oxo-dGTP diphosphatase
MMNFATLCYLRRGNKILLQHKAQGLFGEGRWNAPGGKMLVGEVPEKAAVREVFEETGLRVSELYFNGILNFYLGESKELDQTVFVFSSKRFTGKMRGSSEGELRWFSVDAVPYHEMWEDDQLWLPSVLEGKSIVGDFYFTQDYADFISYEMHQTGYAVTEDNHKAQLKSRLIT